MTAAFLQYLKDQAEAYRKELLYRWSQKHLTEADQHEMRGIVTTLDELSNLSLDVIHRFYGYPELNNDTEA